MFNIHIFQIKRYLDMTLGQNFDFNLGRNPQKKKKKS